MPIAEASAEITSRSDRRIEFVASPEMQRIFENLRDAIIQANGGLPCNNQRLMLQALKFLGANRTAFIDSAVGRPTKLKR